MLGQLLTFFFFFFFARTSGQNFDVKEHLQARRLWPNKSLLFPSLCFFFIVFVPAEISCSAHVFLVSLCKKSSLPSVSPNIGMPPLSTKHIHKLGPSIRRSAVSSSLKMCF